MNTSIAAVLKSRKVSQLSALLSNLGAKSSGRKTDLIARIENVINDQQKDGLTSKQRVLSVDMGIRNLALCAADVQFPTATGHPRLDVIAWKRLDLTKGQELDYSPASLSKTAFALVTNSMLSLKPDTILIERQRFRTSNAPAIQEWTLRVNMLEAMLWSILTALHGSKHPGYHVESMNPARIAAFWARTGAKLEKKEKVCLVEAWIRDGGLDGIDLIFKGDVKDSFNKTRGGEKRDDLADSLLQGVTWAIWTRTRQRLADMTQQELDNIVSRMAT
jgi:cruciform cutting endonuclease 1